MSETRFTWGDSVRVAEVEGALMTWRPGSVGSICGLRTIENEEQARSTALAVGTTVYTVEFEDGESAQVPEYALEPLDD